MTREEAIMANYSQKAKKIKTPFAKMIVEGNQEKPYFSILYFDPIDKDFYVGYSSYCLDYVSNWLNEEFEIVEDENFIIAALRPVSREQVERIWFREPYTRLETRYGEDGGMVYSAVNTCMACGHETPIGNFCHNCGVAQTAEGVEITMKRLEALKDGSTTD